MKCLSKKEKEKNKGKLKEGVWLEACSFEFEVKWSVGLQSNREQGANAECDLMFHCRSKSSGRPSLYVANGRKWRETKIRERHSRTAEAREGEGYFFQFDGLLKQMGSKGEGGRGRKSPISKWKLPQGSKTGWCHVLLFPHLPCYGFLNSSPAFFLSITLCV